MDDNIDSSLATLPSLPTLPAIKEIDQIIIFHCDIDSLVNLFLVCKQRFSSILNDTNTIEQLKKIHEIKWLCNTFADIVMERDSEDITMRTSKHRPLLHCVEKASKKGRKDLFVHYLSMFKPYNLPKLKLFAQVCAFDDRELLGHVFTMCSGAEKDDEELQDHMIKSATRAGNVPLVKALWHHHEDPQLDPDIFLRAACKVKCHDLIGFFLEKGAKQYRTLEYRVETNDIKSIEEIISNNTNCVDKAEAGPGEDDWLHWVLKATGGAIVRNNQHIIDMLLPLLGDSDLSYIFNKALKMDRQDLIGYCLERNTRFDGRNYQSIGKHNRLELVKDFKSLSNAFKSCLIHGLFLGGHHAHIPEFLSSETYPSAVLDLCVGTAFRTTGYKFYTDASNKELFGRLGLNRVLRRAAKYGDINLMKLILNDVELNSGIVQSLIEFSIDAHRIYMTRLLYLQVGGYLNASVCYNLARYALGGDSVDAFKLFLTIENGKVLKHIMKPRNISALVNLAVELECPGCISYLLESGVMHPNDHLEQETSLEVKAVMQGYIQYIECH